MSITVDNLILVQLTNFINEHLEEIPLPIPMLFDNQTATSQQLWTQPLAGTKKIKQYVGGDYVGSLPFAVYSQLTNPNDMYSLDIPLWNLANFFESSKLNLTIATVNKVEMQSTPNAFYRGEDGTCVNQAVFQLIYTKM